MAKAETMFTPQHTYSYQTNYHLVTHKLLTLLNWIQIHKQKASTTSNLHRVIFDNISISTIKTSVRIKKYIYKYTDNQIHIKYTYRLPKVGFVLKSNHRSRNNF